MIVKQRAPTIDIERSRVKTKILASGEKSYWLTSLVPENIITHNESGTEKHLWIDSVVDRVLLCDKTFYDNWRAAKLKGFSFLANGNR